MLKSDDRHEDELPRESVVIAFRAPAELLLSADRIAATEGISRSDVARRALMRDLNREAR